MFPYREVILTLADYDLQKKYSDEISRLRYLGSIDQSIDKCKEASLKFPDSNFFYKILGDLYSQKKDFGNASIAYIEQLKHLNERPDQFKAFARFYQMLEKKTPPDFIKQFRKEILGEIQREKIEPNVIKLIISFLGGEFLQDEGTIAFLKKTDDDRNFAEVKKYVNNLEDIESIQAMIKWRIEAKDRNNSHKTDDYFISVGEKLELYGLTLKLIEKIYSQNAKPNPIVIRTLLRICRKQDDYTFAERILNINSDFVLRSDFNIQYELVYFFEYKCNDELLERTLNRMRTQSATSSIPIARTLYNFYLRLNRFEEAKEISEHIRELEVSRHTSSQISRAEEQLESEQGVWIKLQELISEQEHNRQMIAMRDLLKGFSHELGQPITNIRYSTQLYQMKTQRGLATEEDILTLLQLILNQTERVGKMLKRFSPIVSSESKTDKFNVFNKIKDQSFFLWD